jgi:hypothetical protein
MAAKPTSILDELDARPRGTTGYQCTVAVARHALDEDDREAFDTALTARQGQGWRYSAARIARIVSDRTGIRVSEWVVQRHRREDCACDRAR